MNKKDEIRLFVDKLSKTKATKDSVNMFSYGSKGNDIRRNNLIEYLDAISDHKPSVILVGEAPGYRGSRRTGVPFCSEKLMLSNPFFLSRKNFKIENVTSPIAESSASIVWKTFDELNFYPLIWASFPFHPHKPGDKETNRAPTKEDMNLGRSFLTSLIDIFEIKEIIAVGRSAEKTLAELKIESVPVRHPSHGGANLFKEGITRFVKRKK